MENHGAIFREIHKNTWLKKVTIENKKLSGIQKKVDRYWVVFCVHDDCEALLEGYIEPRQAATHTPDWSIALQSTLHVSHGLIATEQEYEFVITLSTEVLRFYASSWDIMLEWVDTLRLKLREMKILSPKENVYSKWPEIRAPLLPTRDPTSPLPAPPPVPADIIPGIERAITSTGTPVITSSTSTTTATALGNTSTNVTVALIHSPVTTTTAVSNVSSTDVTTTEIITLDSIAESSTILNDSLNNTMGSNASSIPNSVPITSMSNTLSQNLLNMLSNPVTSYSNHIQQNNSRNLTIDSDTDHSIDDDDDGINDIQSVDSDRSILSLTKTFSNNVLSESKTCPAQSSSRMVSTTSSLTLPSMSTSSLIAVLPNSNTQDDFDEIESTSSSSSIFNNEPILIPRPQTSRSTSKDDSSKKILNLSSTPTTTTTTTAMPIAAATTSTAPTSNDDSGSTNITIIQLSSPLASLLTTDKSPASDIFNYPVIDATTSDDNYKSNVQIIPSNNYTPDHINHYGSINNSTSCNVNNIITDDNTITNECSKVTTVQVLGDECATGGSNHHQIKNKSTATVNNDYGKIHKLKKCDKLEIDLANAITNFGPITNIPIGELNFTTPKLHYEQIFITPTVTPIPSATESNSSTSKFTFVSQNTNKSITAIASTANIGTSNSTSSNATATNTNTITTSNTATTTTTTTTSTSHTELYINRIDLNKDSNNNNNNNNDANNNNNTITNIDNTNLNVNEIENNLNSSSINTNTIINDNDRIITTSTANTTQPSTVRPHRPRVEHPMINVQQNKKNQRHQQNNTRNNRGILMVPSSPVPMIRQLLQRGLTEVSIIRPNKKETIVNAQNRGRTKQQKNLNINECPARRNETIEQRRRSSSTSDAHSPRNRTTNAIPNECTRNANRLHPAPQPLRLEIQGGGGGGCGGNNSGGIIPNNCSPNNMNMNNSGNTSRITLREQQVLQLRREMLHPGGVRIQLRRKDCIGSIALVDAFGGVWIAGWKQKDHPILYNALHIGDQLISVSGITVSCSTEANKIFRNTPGLYLDIIIRRVPFGRVYVIRRDMEGQCLGLIRDGNTATIIDVIPNSLSARHGLPPKAQSCDGLTLTFWVLTEINGRPLNLFFKDNEVKDRLNAIGREISILVQPLDLMTKLRKQLKSLRSHKEYIVQ